MAFFNKNKSKIILQQTILPNIKSYSNKILKNNNIKCSYCKILESQSCTNNIHKNGNKIWYVLHNLVECMSIGILTDEECNNTSITILNIIKTLPCKECKMHSLNWHTEKILNNKALNTKELWMYELWYHHDIINKILNIKNSNKLSWSDYKNQVNINKITCKIY